MKEKIDIHGYEHRIELVLCKVRKSDMPEYNKKHILGFYQSLVLRGISAPCMCKYIYEIRNIALWLEKDFNIATKEDLISIVQKVESGQYTEWTKHNYKVTLKLFYRWLKNSPRKQYPPEVDWIMSGIRNSRHKLPEELWTEEEVMKLIVAADNPRDKALIAGIFESGCRIGELCSCRIKHVQFDKYGAVVIVEGKTGMRRIRLVSSVPYLAAWLSNHPEKDNPEAPLWISLGPKHKGQSLAYGAIGRIFHDTAMRSGVKKRPNPHMFRHSRATFLANHLTEAQLKQMFGWTQGSNMAAIYVHMSGRDTDNAILKLNGLGGDERKNEESMLKPVKCPRCEFVNGATSKFCNRCAAPLDIRTALSIEEKTNGLAQSFAEAIGNNGSLTELVKRPDMSQADLERLAQLVAGYMKNSY